MGASQNGNVGVGTSAPSSLLYLKQTNVSNPGYTPVLSLGYDDATTFGGSIGLRVTPGNPRQGLQISSRLSDLGKILYVKYILD